MSEAFLQFIWKFILYDTSNLLTQDQDYITVLQPGEHNLNAGPDFLDARIRIGNEIWCGPVEIHVNSSDWNKHNHGVDPAYEQVILHVVYDNDVDILVGENIKLPVLILKDKIDPSMEKKYLAISKNKNRVPCQVKISQFDKFQWNNFLDRLVVERLERRMAEIYHTMYIQGNNWEQCLYIHLARNFGFKVNADVFESLAQSLPLFILLRHRDSLFQLEALLFGQAGMLNDDFQDNYPNELKNEYEYLKNKYTLVPLKKGVWKYLRMMPANFPSVRISQFALLLQRSSSNLLSQFFEIEELAEMYKMFELKASVYWENHSQFDKVSKIQIKRFGKSSAENVAINTIAPILYFYGRYLKKQDLIDKAIHWLFEIKQESNKVTRDWTQRGFEINSAAQSQGVLELNNEYCRNKKCLNCRIGLNLIK